MQSADFRMQIHHAMDNEEEESVSTIISRKQFENRQAEYAKDAKEDVAEVDEEVPKEIGLKESNLPSLPRFNVYKHSKKLHDGIVRIPSVVEVDSLTPLRLFSLFLNDAMLDCIVKNTNDYAMAHNAGKEGRHWNDIPRLHYTMVSSARSYAQVAASPVASPVASPSVSPRALPVGMRDRSPITEYVGGYVAPPVHPSLRSASPITLGYPELPMSRQSTDSNLAGLLESRVALDLDARPSDRARFTNPTFTVRRSRSPRLVQGVDKEPANSQYWSQDPTAPQHPITKYMSLFGLNRSRSTFMCHHTMDQTSSTLTRWSR
ncbi:hypothetical protein MBANPS3_007999 [Mucor bainieri]